MEYIPTNIRLTAKQHERLRKESFDTKKSQAEIVREALEKHWKEVDQTKLEEIVNNAETIEP